MMYKIHEIALDGSTVITECKNKKATQDYLNFNFLAIVEKIEKETKKSVTDVTDQFSIPHLVEPTDSVESVESDIKSGMRDDNIGLADDLMMFVDDIKFHSVNDFTRKLIDIDIDWVKREIRSERKSKHDLLKSMTLTDSQHFEWEYELKCDYLKRMRNTLAILKRIEKLAKGDA